MPISKPQQSTHLEHWRSTVCVGNSHIYTHSQIKHYISKVSERIKSHLYAIADIWFSPSFSMLNILSSAPNINMLTLKTFEQKTPTENYTRLTFAYIYKLWKFMGRSHLVPFLLYAIAPPMLWQNGNCKNNTDWAYEWASNVWMKSEQEKSLYWMPNQINCFAYTCI